MNYILNVIVIASLEIRTYMTIKSYLFTFLRRNEFEFLVHVALN